MGCLLQRNRRCSSSSSSVLLPLVLVFFLAIVLEKPVGVVSALEYSDDKQANSLRLESIQKYLDKINKPAVMTIESPDGNIIDCIDQWKQPAFDHPILRNHKLQLVPPEVPRERRTKKEEVKGNDNMSSVEIITSQVWHQNGTRCPKGTVPIRRTSLDDVLRAQSLRDFGRKQPKMALADVDNITHEYAVASSKPGNVVYGGSAAINVWNPSIAAESEMSISQIWVFAGSNETSDLNTVNPSLFGDSKTRLFVYWTADGYKSTGCYNLQCPGFVQVDKNIVVGSDISPSSTISGPQNEAFVYIWKDPKTSNWWLGYGDKTTPVGYWPAELFTSLRESATMVEWGGEVTNAKLNGAHTSTQMGSGRFAQEGLGKASYFRTLGVVDSNNDISPPTDSSITVTNSNCYNIDLRSNNDWGVHFFYGGPGFNPNCP